MENGNEAKNTGSNGSSENIIIGCTAVLACLFVVGIIYTFIARSQNGSPDIISLIALTGAFVVDICIFIAAVTRKTARLRDIQQKQYQELYEAEKASYLVLRKSFDEMNAKLNAIGESGSIPADEIIKAQKALAKVTINRSKENADALMNSNDNMIKAFNSIQDMVDSGNDSLFEKERAVLDGISRDITAQTKELAQQNKDIEKQIQSVAEEIRVMKSSINALEQSQRAAISSQPVMMAFQAMPQYAGQPPVQQVPVQPQMMQQPVMQPQYVPAPGQPVAQQAPEPENDAFMPDDELLEEPVSAMERYAVHKDNEETAPADDLFADTEEAGLGDFAEDTGDISEESELSLDDIGTDFGAEEGALEADAESELSLDDIATDIEGDAEANPAFSIDDITLNPEEAANKPELSLEYSAEAESADEPELSLDDIATDLGAEEGIAAEAEPELSLEDIATEPALAEEPALEAVPEAIAEPEPVPEEALAAEAVAEPAPEAVPEPEPVTEAASEPEPAPEPEPESAPAEPIDLSASGVDLSGDPNKALSPDDIAKLFASAAPAAEPAAEPEPAPAPEPEPEPASEPAPAEPIDLSASGVDLSGDPNKALSPDDIAKLFASAAPAAEPAVAEPAPAPDPEPAPEPAPIDLSASGVDLSGDPNKALSPDDIAKLFASVQ